LIDFNLLIYLIFIEKIGLDKLNFFPNLSARFSDEIVNFLFRSGRRKVAFGNAAGRRRLISFDWGDHGERENAEEIYKQIKFNYQMN